MGNNWEPADGPETVGIDPEEIKEYLDGCIMHWRSQREAGNEIAKYYIDAFQSVRNSIFGEVLPPESTEKAEKIEIDDEAIKTTPGPEVLKKHKNPVISIKPKYAEMIYAGEKKVELRKATFGREVEGAYVYETAPTKEITGVVKFGSILKAPLDVLWDHVKDKAGISKEEFDAYYEGHKTGVGLFIEDFVETGRMKSPLWMLRELYGFTAPQSIGYIELDNEFDYESIKYYYKRVNGLNAQ